MSLGGLMSHKIWKPLKLSWGSVLIEGNIKGLDLEKWFGGHVLGFQV